MPLVPRAPLVSRLSQRAAPTLLRMMTSAAWRPRALGATALLAEQMARRFDQFSQASRLTSGTIPRLLLRLPGLAFPLRRRPVSPAGPVAEAEPVITWRSRPSWSTPVVLPSSTPVAIAQEFGQPDMPAEAVLPADPVAESASPSDGGASSPVAEDQAPVVAPPTGTAAGVNMPGPSIDRLAETAPVAGQHAATPPGETTVPVGSGETPAGTALAEALLGRHSVGWTQLLAETEVPEAVAPTESAPAETVWEEWTAAGEPVDEEGSEPAWPALTGSPDAPTHPFARLLARLPDRPAGQPASPPPGLIGRPPLVLARAAAAAGFDGQAGAELPAASVTPPESEHVAEPGAAPLPMTFVPVARAVTPPQAGEPVERFAGGSPVAGEVGPAPGAPATAAGPWPMLAQPSAPTVFGGSSAEAGSPMVAASHDQLLEPVAVRFAVSRAISQPLQPAGVEATPEPPLLSRLLQPPTSADRPVEAAPALEMPLTPPVLPPAVATGLAAPTAPETPVAPSPATGAAAGPFAWTPVHREAAAPPSSPPADEPAPPTIGRSLPLVQPEAPVTLVPFSPGTVEGGGADPARPSAVARPGLIGRPDRSLTRIGDDGPEAMPDAEAGQPAASWPVLVARAPLGPLGGSPSAGLAESRTPLPFLPTWLHHAVVARTVTVPGSTAAGVATDPTGWSTPALPWMPASPWTAIGQPEGRISEPVTSGGQQVPSAGQSFVDASGEAASRPVPAAEAASQPEPTARLTRTVRPEPWASSAGRGTGWDSQFDDGALAPSLDDLIMPTLPALARPTAPPTTLAVLPLVLQRRWGPAGSAAAGSSSGEMAWGAISAGPGLAALGGGEATGGLGVAATGWASSAATAPVEARGATAAVAWPVETLEPPSLALTQTPPPSWVGEPTPALARSTMPAPLPVLARRPSPTVLTGQRANEWTMVTGAGAAGQPASGAPVVALERWADGPATEPLPLLARRSASPDDVATPEWTPGVPRPLAPRDTVAADWEPDAPSPAEAEPPAEVGPTWPAPLIWPGLTRFTDGEAGVLPVDGDGGTPMEPLALPVARPALSPIQRAATARRVAARRAETSRGEPLPLLLRSPFEQLFRTSFEEVTVHTDEAASEATTAVGAAAMTIGPRIFFAPGRFRPAEPEGDALLAHELTHVVQQRTGPLQMALKSVDGVAAAPEAAGIEREAERSESRVRELYQSGGFAAPTMTLARAATATTAAPRPTDAVDFVGGGYEGGPALGTDDSPALARIASVSYSNGLSEPVQRVVQIDEMTSQVDPGQQPSSGGGGANPMQGPELRKLANEIFEIIKEKLSYERERRGRWL